MERLVNPQEIEELERLEIRQMVSTLLYSHPQLQTCDRTLMRRLSGIMIRADGIEQAQASWKNLILKSGDNYFTESQKREISLDESEIGQLYCKVQELLVEIKPGLIDELTDRITHKYGHQWNDEYEQRQKPKRSLEVLKRNGIRIKVPLEHIELIRRKFIEGAECPILDKVKNMRIVTINGFEGSKMSLTIHDIFDHFWFYSRLERLGILDRYSAFLQSVGNPQDTDIFKREGELIASISFDYRGYTVSEPGFNPVFTFDQIRRRLAKSPAPSDNQIKAIERLQSMDYESEEAKGLCFILSGLCIELMEQRRKHGFIRTLDTDYQINGILGILDPEYISLVIEGNAVLFNPEEHADSVLLNISVMVEDYLIRLARGEVTEDLVITIEDLEGFDPYSTAVSQERITWIQENIGFAANRRDQC